MFTLGYLAVIIFAFTGRLVDLGKITNTITTKVPFTPKFSPEYDKRNYVFENETGIDYSRRKQMYDDNLWANGGPLDIEVFVTFMTDDGQEWIEDSSDVFCDEILSFWLYEIGIHDRDKEQTEYERYKFSNCYKEYRTLPGRGLVVGMKYTMPVDE